MTISPISPSADLGVVGSRRAGTPRRAIGVPTEPGLIGRSGWLNEAIGEVSDSPYPSSSWNAEPSLDLVQHLHRQRRAAGRGQLQPAGVEPAAGRARRAAPCTWSARRGRRSPGPRPRSAAPPRRRTSAAGSGSAPPAIAAFSPQVCPKEWNSGRPPKTTSPGSIGISVARSVAHVAAEVGVGELGALRLAGGARGVEDDRGVVAGADVGHRRRAASAPASSASNSPGVDDDHVGAGDLGGLGRLLGEQRRTPPRPSRRRPSRRRRPRPP